MKHVKIGDILTVETGIIVHGCNAQGVMGSGIAKQIRDRWPACYTSYKQAVLKMSSPLGVIIPFQISPELIIINGITQEHFGKDCKKYVSYRAIGDVFTSVADIALKMQLPVHYPLIGAGLGGGDWAVISEIIDSCFALASSVERTLWVYE